MGEAVFEGQSDKVASLVMALTRRLLSSEHDPAAEMPLAQLRVCGVLHGGPRSLSAVGRELRVSVSAMTQIADRLERARLVKRVSDGGDRRVKCLQLTARAEEIMRRRQEERVGRVSAALENLSPRAREEVVAALEKLVHACEAVGQQAAPLTTAEKVSA